GGPRTKNWKPSNTRRSCGGSPNSAPRWNGSTRWCSAWAVTPKRANRPQNPPRRARAVSETVGGGRRPLMMSSSAHLEPRGSPCLREPNTRTGRVGHEERYEGVATTENAPMNGAATPPAHARHAPPWSAELGREPPPRRWRWRELSRH